MQKGEPGRTAVTFIAQKSLEMNNYMKADFPKVRSCFKPREKFKVKKRQMDRIDSDSSISDLFD